MSNSYRDEQIAFVSGFSGTTVEEVFLVCAVLPLAVVLRGAWFTLGSAESPTTTSLHLGSFFMDFMCIVIPGFLSVTFTETCTTTLALCVCVIFILAVRAQLSLKACSTGPDQLLNDGRVDALNSRRKVFISDYRSTMMLLTCLAILAVDFTIFPRRFVKTESFGTSLMDVGVGSFVFSSAITAAGRLRNGGTSMVSLFFSSVKPILPLVVLGLLRLVTIKGTDYQEHVSEYGVHWNFYFTMASVSLAYALLALVPMPSAIMGLAIGGAYQYLLSSHGVATYILDAPRIDIISANKEGLWSCIGMFLLCRVFQVKSSSRLVTLCSCFFSSSCSVAIPSLSHTIRLFHCFGCMHCFVILSLHRICGYILPWFGSR